jgi:Cu2+-exporting ATPase
MHIDLPIAVGIVGSFAGSLYGWFVGDERLIYFDFVGSFIVLMLIGRWAQVAAVDRNRRRLLARQPTPPRVRLLGSGEVGRSIPPEELVSGQRFELTPGQTLPVEARLEAGAAEFSLASINGEPAPRVFQPGQRVPAGAVLLSRGAVGVEALQPWRESLLARLLRPMEREADRDPVLERIIRGYLVGIFAIAIGSGVVWAVLTGDAARTWSVVTAVLVVSCPCAIGLAVPLAAEMAIVALRRRGVFVRESGVFARLGRVRRVIFDKTETLTLEAPILRAPGALEALPAGVQGALLALVRDNLHPVAQALAFLGWQVTEAAEVLTQPLLLLGRQRLQSLVTIPVPLLLLRWQVAPALETLLGTLVFDHTTVPGWQHYHDIPFTVAVPALGLAVDWSYVLELDIVFDTAGHSMDVGWADLRYV